MMGFGKGNGTLLKWQFWVSIPGDPITLSEDDWGVQSPPQQGI